MCGILGVWRFDGCAVDLPEVRQALATIRHRGPDGEGYLLINTQMGRVVLCGDRETDPYLGLPHIEEFFGEHFDLVLAHRRLAIIDLSPAGHQPMASTDGTCWIVYNGEVYNYLELRTELESYGHEFRTGTDTEVILAAYKQWGKDCLRHFNGMWAFALWDAAQRWLFCARDRFGVKPFYYHAGRGQFVFASEIKALLACPDCPRAPNDRRIYDYLTLGLTDHTEETCFQGIQQLRPSQALCLSTGEAGKVWRWFDVEVNEASSDRNGTNEMARIRQFRDLFESSVALRLRSDVPIGTCLSGGLDSSAIVVTVNDLMRTHHGVRPELIGERQRTFTACYDDPTVDERRFSEQIIEMTGAQANYVFPDGKVRLWEELDQLVWHQDEPFGSTSIYAQWNVMRLASDNGVTVLLDGQGADELLAGYGQYVETFLAQLITEGRLLKASQEASLGSRNWKTNALAQLVRSLRWGLPQQWIAPLELLRRAGARSNSRVGVGFQGLNPEFATIQLNNRVAGNREMHRNLPRSLYFSVFEQGLPALLRHEDRNSMAFSLEARVPFLDYRLVEYVFSLPADYRIRDGWSKWILRRAMNDMVPSSICWRRDKIGFATPQNRWFIRAAPHIESLLRDGAPEIARYLDTDYILANWQRFCNGTPAASWQLWRWLNLAAWLRRFF